jgi:hypothetical protein
MVTTCTLENTEDRPQESREDNKRCIEWLQKELVINLDKISMLRKVCRQDHVAIILKEH